MHIWEDNYIVEIIDPVTLKPVPDGEEGELVMTTLLREGMPILRYRTKDLTRIIPGPCPCGRTHRRIERIKGRTDDMMILKGVNIFPIQIEKKLMEIPGVGTNFLIILDREGYNDQMTVKVEVQKEFFGGDLKQLEALRRRIVEELKSDILITPRVDLVEPDSLPKSEGKATAGDRQPEGLNKGGTHDYLSTFDLCGKQAGEAGGRDADPGEGEDQHPGDDDRHVRHLRRHQPDRR